VHKEQADQTTRFDFPGTCDETLEIPLSIIRDDDDNLYDETIKGGEIMFIVETKTITYEIYGIVRHDSKGLRDFHSSIRRDKTWWNIEGRRVIQSTTDYCTNVTATACMMAYKQASVQEIKIIPGSKRSAAARFTPLNKQTPKKKSKPEPKKKLNTHAKKKPKRQSQLVDLTACTSSDDSSDYSQSS
jgi:hypothetical protein